MRIKSVEDLETLREEGVRRLYPGRLRVNVGMATCGLATGAENVFTTVQEEAKRFDGKIVVAPTGCLGFCQMEPIVDVALPDGPRIVYHEMTGEKARALMEALAVGNVNLDMALCWIPSSNGREGPPGGMAPDFLGELPSYNAIDFYTKQHKIALQNCGLIDPHSILEYIATGGYFSLYKALHTLSQEEILQIITRSGLRGRGGAGFRTGVKWRFAWEAPSPEKFIICNADEGDPGAYMDRSIIEGDPHIVLEGLIIGAFCIGANQGFVYVRDEYPQAIEKLQIALEDAREFGLLGRDILGSGFNFDVKLNRGAGSFVCGEETSLMASIEGRLGEPRQRPPFPVERGIWGKPTVINNVETLANVPKIIEHGDEWFSAVGTEGSKGTKVFSVVGNIKNTGLVEVPMGITLRDIVFDIGGGVPDGKRFKAVQTGGPSGGCIPQEHLDLPVDFESLTEAGAIMGSGGMIVMDEDTCMVDVARYFLDFLKEESCGKCVPCREGINQLLEILAGICAGRGKEGDIELLEEVASCVKDFSLCALGGTAPNPVLSTIKYFRDEYEEHIQNRRCPAHVCTALVHYAIDQEKCTMCGRCAKECPTGAILGKPKTLPVMDESMCTKCGICFDTCKFDGIARE